HRIKIDREIVAAEAAIAAHRADLSAFFADLSRETDAVAFAQMAVRRPLFPSVETVAERQASAPPEVASTTSPEPTRPATPVAVGAESGPMPATPVARPAVETTTAIPATATPAPAAPATEPEAQPA